jgi:extracellular elastinolytic metalloproteinase
MAGRGSQEVQAPSISNRTIPGDQLAPVVAPGAAFNDVGGSFVQRAREHLRLVEGFGGLPAEFEAAPRETRTSGGRVAVHLRQQFKSIPVFLAAQTVRFKRDGSVDSASGFTFTFNEDAPVEPRLSVPDAVLAAAKQVADLVSQQGLLGENDDFGNALVGPAVNLTGFQPTIIAAFVELPARPTVVAPGPFGHHIKASLIWYPKSPKVLLAWQVILTMPQGSGQYLVIVDANSGAILYYRQLADLLIGRGSVYVVDGTARQMTSFPRPWTDYAAGFDPGALPSGVSPQPAQWVDDTTQDTSGNCVFARLGESGPPLKARLEGGQVIFEPSDPNGDDQKVLNMFYYNSYLHDLFYLLGFREEDGNFQAKGIGGLSGDPVDARAHSGAVWGTANMFTPPDGTSPVMNMGLVVGTNRHTAFDASVVFHEYMHGVTNRLVGGPMNTNALEQPQSKAMGEGWGDYVACTLTNTNVVGPWVTNQPGGIRSHPYDDQYPGTFGQLGQGIYVAPHKVGEIWCAALLAMNRNLNVRLGTPRGQRLGLQLVVDALKLSPANPNMLDMRDSILSALEHKRDASPGLSTTDIEAAKAGIWAAFAKFGMGFGAKSTAANFGDVVEDFTTPASGTTPITPGSGTTPTTPTSTTPTTPTTPTIPQPPNTPVGGIERLSDPLRGVIPDNDPTGIKRLLQSKSVGRIKRATVRIDITHEYVADLLIKLAPPGRPHIILHNQAFQDAPDLIATYTTSNKLAPLIGQQAQGDWILLVADLSPEATGALRKWELEIEVEDTAGVSGFTDPSAASDVDGLAAHASGLLRQLGDVVLRLGRMPR